jgi:hypothetical protein
MLELSDDEEMERHRRLHAEEKQREQARAVLRNMLMRQNDDLFGRTQCMDSSYILIIVITDGRHQGQLVKTRSSKRIP